MPLYPYQCPQCEHRFEKLMSMAATTPPPCPECGSPDTERGFGLPAKAAELPTATNCRGNPNPRSVSGESSATANRDQLPRRWPAVRGVVVWPAVARLGSFAGCNSCVGQILQWMNTQNLSIPTTSLR
jgi:putative FmdB family regulatory protein